MRSFDLFDTLLGRLHYRPESIFFLVEKQFPFPGFVLFRTLAECKSDRTFPDIYRHFQQLTEITDDQTKALMQFEFKMELSQIFPIVENCNLVKNGDLIVSDTCYDKHQIREILNKIGLNRQVKIYASPCGKSSGMIWDLIKKKHTISSHLGDSLHSDIAMPLYRKIAASHYSNSQLSLNERKMMEMDQDELACMMRALRLLNPYPSQSPENLIWNEQCQLNVPVLIQASLYLNDFCQKHDKNRILFTSRDGCLWIRLFQKLFPQYDSIYFHASRYTYNFPTPSYIEYVKNIYSDRTIIVDSHGKGRSCETFFKKHLKIDPAYLAIVNSGKKHFAILRSRSLHEEIEKINSDLVGTLYDVQDEKPLRSKPEYDLRFIKPMHSCMKKCLEIISYFTLQKFDARVVKWAVKSMKSGLVLDKYFDHAKMHFHVFDKNHSLRHIHCLKNGLLFEPDSLKK